MPVEAPKSEPSPPGLRPDISLAFVLYILGVIYSFFPPHSKSEAVAWIVVLLVCAYYPFLHFSAVALRRPPKSLRAQLLCIALVVIVGGVLLHQQWIIFRPTVQVHAEINPTVPAGTTEYGIKWIDGASNVRIVFTDLTVFPIRNFDLTVKVVNKSGDTLYGMGQITSISGCEFHGPRMPAQLGFDATGTNGKNYRIPPPAEESSFGSEWGVSCSSLPAGVPLNLAVAVMNEKKGEQPTQLNLVGSFEIVSVDGSRVGAFNKTINISRVASSK
jgi:hypothetical protein